MKKSGFLSLGLFLCMTATAAPSKTAIVMGFNPAESAEAVDNHSKAFAAEFKARTGIEVKTFIATDYTAVVEALRSGKIDFAWLPPFSLLKAEKIAGGKPLLKAVRKGHATYYGSIFVRTDRGFKAIEDLKGKTIAWVDPSSTSGHIFPKAELIEKKKINPDQFFKRQVFAGAHDAVVLSVLNGTVDAGATFVNDDKGIDGAWTLFLKGDDQKKVKPIYITEPFPGDTLSTSNQFYSTHRDVVDATVQALESMGKDPAGKKVLMELYRIEAMVPATSKDFDNVRAAARALHLD